MMLRALAAPALLALAPAALAQGVPSDNAAPLAAEHALLAAQQHADRAALETLIAPDFLFVRGSGRIGNRGDYIAGFTDPNIRLQPFEISDPLFLRAAPDVAIAGGEGWVRGTDHGRTFAEHYRYSDTLVLRDGRWQVVFAQVTPLPAD